MITLSLTNAASPSHTPCASSPVATEPVATTATDDAMSPETLRIQEVASRLIRYRDHYDSEITFNQERVKDINEAIDRYQSEADANGSRSRAIQVLTASLADAQKCLDDASLARTRIDHELALWIPAKSAASDKQQS
ncbi:hypothetical protein EV178_000302 [Coemansia sp. RSA 1646]|nr:hypothetical protein EV178_000302 [Coemansia sp. RSA 1646]KAJ1772054.1 hypothetical protein LPJ74_001789 [Coemansia sp. RSA 1843]KAJ2090595.1 hypothetical protein IW138_002603 [Coemansia sp. RSA 986]